jgi:hypothetical protein
MWSLKSLQNVISEFRIGEYSDHDNHTGYLYIHKYMTNNACRKLWGLKVPIIHNYCASTSSKIYFHFKTIENIFI